MVCPPTSCFTTFSCLRAIPEPWICGGPLPVGQLCKTSDFGCMFEQHPELPRTLKPPRRVGSSLATTMIDSKLAELQGGAAVDLSVPPTGSSSKLILLKTTPTFTTIKTTTLQAANGATIQAERW